MPDLKLIAASDGNGEAVQASVTSARAISSTTLVVDSVANFPDYFILTTGELNSDGEIDPSSVQVMLAHLSGSNIEIDSFAPGYPDIGNSVGNLALIKPTTEWANQIAALLGVTMNDDGTFNSAAITDMLGSGKTATDLRMQPRLDVSGSAATLEPNVDEHNYYRRTAQAAALTIANPTGTPLDGEGLLIEIGDNGTSRALTWGSEYTVDSIYGLTLPTATVAGKTHFITFIRNESLGQWVAVL